MDNLANLVVFSINEINKKGIIILFFCSLSIVTTAQNIYPVKDSTSVVVASTENTISLKDAKEISYQAQATIESLQGTLNYITFNDNAASELADVITNSYKDSRSRVFYDSNIIIEDDLNPQSGLGNTKDITAIDYLNKMDLQYYKTGDASINFSNIVVSNVKKKDYIFVNVIFDANYGSKYKPDGSTYPKKQRCALVRVDRSGANKWEAYIMSISFYNPANPIENSDNNMQIATDLTTSASLVSQEDFDKEKEDFIRLKQEEEKRKLAIFDEYLSLGNTYLKNKQFKEALEIYEKAKELQPMVPSLDKKIIDSKKLVAENTFENYNNKGDRAKTERRFDEAIQFYKQAITLKPYAAAELGQTISMLTQKLAIIALPKNKLQSKDFKGAIEECERVLRERKKEKNDFPELYYIKGVAYLEWGIQSNDARKFDDALENLNTALQYFPNYKVARLERAELYVNQKHDLISAITDYDVLATNEFDDSPDKPAFFVAKAKLKDNLKNITGAIADYDQALILNPMGASIYFDKGELEYRLKQFSAAENNFSTAIKLNPDYKNAYYYRGLSYHNQNKIREAGADFEKLEKLGLDSEQTIVIDSISEMHFKEGENLFANHDFQKAHLAYDNALAIRKCNAKALHKKAEIWLRTGDELRIQTKNEQEGLSNFNQSIEFNKRAILCNPKFSEAQFKKGIAYNKIGEASLAIASFSEAIESDSNSVVAYIERGNTYQAGKKYTEAIESYIAVIPMLQTQMEASKKSADKSLPKKLNDDLANVYMLIGESYYDNNDYPNAMLS
jgi:tetratricopeptide (TPR) repeat protein